jgi:hypothetical protein
MRRMLFGTFHMPGYRHYYELAHMHRHPRELGITAAVVLAYDDRGEQVCEERLDATRPVIPLHDVLPRDRGNLLVAVDVRYDIDRCELTYGYLDLPGSGTSGVYYPLNFTKGLRDRRSYLNTGNFSFGSLPEWVRPILFLGNFSDFGQVAGRLRLHYGEAVIQRNVAIAPKRMQMIEIASVRDGHRLGYLEFVSTARLATYMMGMGPRGGFTFFEHLMPLAR